MIVIKENESLIKHCTFFIGGSAKYFCVAKNQSEVLEAIVWAINKKLDYKVIGGGSNLLISDKGYQGLIIKYFSTDFKIENEIIEAEAGVPLALLINKALKQGLAGLEWAIGIPGTIGGAVCNNSGAYGGEIAQSFVEAKVFQDGVITILKNKDFNFSYHNSKIKEEKIKTVILTIKLALKKVKPEVIMVLKEKMQNNLLDRLSKTPKGGSVGSIFRNFLMTTQELEIFKKKFPQLPEKFINSQVLPAAWLIDECGLKGRKIGDAMVSEVHAGKIINQGKATAEDVIILISIIKQKVRSKFNLQLIEEVEYLGF